MLFSPTVLTVQVHNTIKLVNLYGSKHATLLLLSFYVYSFLAGFMLSDRKDSTNICIHFEVVHKCCTAKNYIIIECWR